MTEDEWRATAAAQAAQVFAGFIVSVVMNILGGGVGGLLTKIVSAYAEKKIQQPRLGAFTATFDADREEAIRNASFVIASWSAFEAYIEDFCKGVLKVDPSIIGNDDFKKIKIPIGELLAPEDEKLDTIYQAMQDFVGKAAGNTRFNQLLGLLGLDGEVPDLIKDEIYAAYMVRNVWAHKAGVADLKFVKQAPQLGYVQGELVSLTLDQLTNYVYAISAYAMIVVNRHRATHGLGPMPWDDAPSVGPIRDAYLDMYPTLRPQEESAEEAR